MMVWISDSAFKPPALPEGRVHDYRMIGRHGYKTPAEVKARQQAAVKDAA
jgi:hypothetical protein